MAFLDNLISYWKLDETSGTRVDSHGSNDLTDNNSVLYDTGKIGNAGDFVRANSEYLSHADNADLSIGTGQSFTFSFWIYPHSVSNDVSIFEKATASSGVGMEYQCRGDTHALKWYISDGSTTSNVQINNQIILNTWSFIVVGYDAKNDFLFASMNGVAKNTTSQSNGLWDSTHTFKIGGQSRGYHDGLIDEMGFWKRALTDDEITKLYNDGSGLAYPFTWTREDVSTTSLISHWKLEETSGTRIDAHGSNDLTDNNTVLYDTGAVDYAGDFEASNSEYLSVADNPSNSLGDIDFTYAAWVKFKSFSASNQDIIHKGNVAVVAAHIYYRYSSTSISFNVNGVSESSTVNSAITPVIDAWYFVVCWHDSTANTINLQINNGNIISSAHSVGVYPGDSALFIGTNLSLSSFLDGLIDEVSIWKRILTAQERTDLYNGGAGVTYPFTVAQSNVDKTSLISYWKLDETSGTRVDSHGSNDLTDNNSVLYDTGKIGNAGDFEASNSEYLSVADNPSNSLGDIDFTYAAWVKFKSFSASNQDIIHKGNVAVAAAHIYYRNSSTSISFNVNGVSEPSTVNSAITPVIDAWYFVVCWHDSTANTINLQINNGNIISSAHSVGVYPGDSALFIGTNLSLSSFLDGLVDEVSIWKRILTAQERTDLYNDGVGFAYPLVVSGAVVIPRPSVIMFGNGVSVI